MRTHPRRPLLLLSCLLLAATGLPATVAAQAQAQADPSEDSFLLAAGFLDGHPDLRHRTAGLEAYGREEYAKAIEQFKRAAWYGDKPSQAIVGEMYWAGFGVPEDRVLALVWMDLAAERGYRFFSQKRDFYWNQLTEEERRTALGAARALHREYADDAAQPRLTAALRRERSKMTGSRVGSLSSAVQVIVPGVGTIDGSRYYDPKFWDPREYRAAQDAYWMELEVRQGRVDVGEVEKLDTPPLVKP